MKIKNLLIALALTPVMYFGLCILIACWMSSGGWNYTDHKLFFHCWTIIPTVSGFIGITFDL